MILTYESGKRTVFTTDGNEHPLTGLSIYFMRSNPKKNLSEETFQVPPSDNYYILISIILKREILVGPLSATKKENLLWQVERMVSNIFIPFLNSKAMEEKASATLIEKVKKDLLPCLRSFTRFAPLHCTYYVYDRVCMSYFTDLACPYHKRRIYEIIILCHSLKANFYHFLSVKLP